jgi:hypothetical protein
MKCLVHNANILSTRLAQTLLKPSLKLHQTYNFSSRKGTTELEEADDARSKRSRDVARSVVRHAAHRRRNAIQRSAALEQHEALRLALTWGSLKLIVIIGSRSGK